MDADLVAEAARLLSERAGREVSREEALQVMERIRLAFCLLDEEARRIDAHKEVVS